MSAYVILTRERTRDQAELDVYDKLAPSAFAGHPAKFLAFHGRHEVLEGPATEDVVVAAFPLSGRRKPGITVPPIGRLASTAFRAGTSVVFWSTAETSKLSRR